MVVLVTVLGGSGAPTRHLRVCYPWPGLAPSQVQCGIDGHNMFVMSSQSGKWPGETIYAVLIPTAGTTPAKLVLTPDPPRIPI